MVRRCAIVRLYFQCIAPQNQTISIEGAKVTLPQRYCGLTYHSTGFQEITNMKIRLLIPFLFLLVLAAFLTVKGSNALVAVAEEWSHPSGFKFWLPDNWKTKSEGDFLSAEGQGVAAFFFVPKNSRSLDRTLEELDKELAGWLKDIKLDKPSTSNINGVSEIYITGTGKDRDDGEDVEFDVGIYEKKGKLLVFLGVTSAEDFDEHHPTFQKIIDSIH
jgi:hypothetical protein